MSFRFQFRRGTTAERDASNPILAAGEPAVVLDSGQPAELVLGDGVTAMADLRAAVWDDDARLTLAGTATQPGDLGTAAAADASDFATAAQGAKADVAIRFDAAQSLTAPEQERARANIRIMGVGPVPTWRRPMDGATLVTNFDTGHGWNTFYSASVDGTVSSPLGAQSVKLLTVSSGNKAELGKSGLSLDLSGANRLVMALNFMVPGGEYVLYIGDSTLANYYQFTFGPQSVNTGWQYMEFAVQQAFSVVGTPTPGALTRVKITATNLPDTTPVLHIGAIAVRTVSLYPNGVWTPSFDDSNVTDYTLARPILGKYGMAAETNLICDVVGTNPANYLSESQVRALYEESGWDIAFHCYALATHSGTGFNALTPAQMDAEFSAGKDWLISRGYPATTWAAPYGNINNDSWAACRKYFANARTTGAPPAISGTFQAAPALRPQLLRAANWTQGQLANMKAGLDAAKATKSWVLTNLHTVKTVPDANGAASISTADLDALCVYAQSIGIAVKTTAQIREETSRAATI